MEKWLRTGTLKRKANETGDVIPNCDNTCFNGEEI
jgi:hypothetical protein